MPGITDWKVLLLREVGAGLDGLPDPVQAAVLDQVTPYLDTYWEMNRRHALIWPDLQYLYTKRMSLDVLIGQNRDRINVSIQGANIPQSTIVSNLETMRKAVQEEIERLETRAQQSRAPALGAIASQTQMDAAGRVFDPLSPPRLSTRRTY